MPYGLPGKMNTQENNKWMENCVSSVMAKQPANKKDKGSAVAICKANLMKHGGNMMKASIDMDFILSQMTDDSTGN